MTVAAVRDVGWSGFLVAIALVLVAIAGVVPVDGTWRLLPALAFVLLAPGASLVPHLHLRDIAMEAALVVPLSISVVILTSAVLFYTNNWTPARELGILAGICVVSVAGRVIANIVRTAPNEPEDGPDMGRSAGRPVSGPKGSDIRCL